MSDADEKLQARGGDMDALKPCPFCGSEAEFSLGKTGGDKDWHYLECSECEAMGPRVQYADHNIAVKDALAEVWNRRAAPDMAELVEALRIAGPIALADFANHPFILNEDEKRKVAVISAALAKIKEPQT